MPGDLIHPLIPYVGGLVAALTGGAYLGYKGDQNLKSLPTVRGKPKAVGALKKEHGIDVGYAHSPAAAGENAFFATKKDLEDIIKDPMLDKKDIKTFTKLVRQAREHGLIVTGKGFKKPGVIEHELGHALAANKGTPWEKFTHGDVPPALQLLGTMGGLGGGYIIGGMKGPLVGALTALGISGLTSVPMVHREMIANRYGAEMMTPEMQEKVKNWPFLGSYINAGITMPTVGGALSGLGHHFPGLSVR